ncbi:hypothetical protein [Streptomyces zagrosensis]|uniref:Uncharacterized protein n=1 Tax=Streptomyces zagrosensis TaxID=1042984 RepID=A0A7W9Q949_9ACTN|nr:hypothetical protein [Streptomyces zagrosensis]MBB5935649.1 hypothetical protein [Streptomyces zagrosensis]
MTSATKSLLWLMLGLCLGLNVMLSVVLDEGGTETVLSVLTGICALAAAVGLFAMRRADR